MVFLDIVHFLQTVGQWCISMVTRNIYIIRHKKTHKVEYKGASHSHTVLRKMCENSQIKNNIVQQPQKAHTFNVYYNEYEGFKFIRSL